MAKKTVVILINLFSLGPLFLLWQWYSKKVNGKIAFTAPPTTKSIVAPKPAFHPDEIRKFRWRSGAVEFTFTRDTRSAAWEPIVPPAFIRRRLLALRELHAISGKRAGAAYEHPAPFFGLTALPPDKVPIFQSSTNWNLSATRNSSPSLLASSNGARRASPHSKTRTAKSVGGMEIGSQVALSPALAISSKPGWDALALSMSPSLSIPSFKNSRPSPAASPFRLKRAEPSIFFNTKTDHG